MAAEHNHMQEHLIVMLIVGLFLLIKAAWKMVRGATKPATRQYTRRGCYVRRVA